MLGTATVTCGRTLTAEVKVLREINSGYYEVEVITGVGGWDKPGKILGVRKEITEMHDVEPAPVAVADEPAELTAPVTGEEYMEILLARQAAYVARHQADRITLRFPPLLDWFVRDGDEQYVVLPETTPAPKRVTTPRVYRSADSLREERATVQAKLDAFADVGPYDPAVVNLSPYSRSKAAASAGRRRFAKMDNDLIKFVALCKRRDALDSRICRADAREKEAGTRG
jgi:hypothetical protein